MIRDATFDLAVIGGGPAGLTAAIEASNAGLRVALIDEKTSLGGQIFRQPLPEMHVTEDPADRQHIQGAELIARAQNCGSAIICGAAVWGMWGSRIAMTTVDGHALEIDAARTVLATGAYDRPIAFPGWTLPGVMAAGGTHSMVKTQRVLPGKHVLVAGSGPLLLMFAAQLVRFGANVVAVVEAAPRPGPLPAIAIGRAARFNTRVLLDGLGYLAYLWRRRIPVLYSQIIVRAEGDSAVERAVIARVDRDWDPIPQTERSYSVDTICLGYGLVPATELAALVGADFAYAEDLGESVPVRDEWMRTSVRNVYAAGDGCGISGAEAAMCEGAIAGIAASMDAGAVAEPDAVGRASPARRRLNALRRFGAALASVYPVGSGVYRLAGDDTIVCRCEEVTASEIISACRDGGYDPNVVKALTRAGMGDCQGRECSRQISGIVAAAAKVPIGSLPRLTARAPVRPVSIGVIASERNEDASVGAEG